MTDYKWEIKQRRKQKDLFLNYRNVQMGDGNSTQIDSLRTQQSKYDVISSLIYSLLHIKSTISISCIAFSHFVPMQDDIAEDYNMLTTVSIPVYDRRESAVS